MKCEGKAPTKGTHLACACFVLLVSFLFVNRAVGNLVLYDVDFDQPFHTVGEQIQADTGPAPRHSVSRRVTGNQIVRDSFGPLDNRPVEFISKKVSGGPFYYSQVDFDVDFAEDFPFYEVSFQA